MKSAVASECEQHVGRRDCPDALINYSAKFDEYGIIVHDGGSSSISIDYCPWCGSKLPEPQRDRWFDELEKLGITDPIEQEIPEVFADGRWRNNKKQNKSQHPTA
ncbi:hypothetical protein JIN85_19205 [Luteolibacter pohnpeiensis]|uniref:DUF6980 domain-containing protein n=2 Tax=Luteolibacter pohnpeiensis TaxID=454153 RepID=A0A934S9D9_9BACT|nr:hypothetical protein [Luteolibacter pohnpeiensis]MBK1884552.1 hypothetical protein [Luteolibacter pohnpeiensis]